MIKTSSLSLKARAVALLAQREQSRQELRRKLLRIAATPPSHDGSHGERGEGASRDVADQVDALLDELEIQGLLSAERFVASRIRTREARFGTERIQRELAQHGLALPAEQRLMLRDTELDRAREVWQRKFGAPAGDAPGRARQARFLTGRGFSADVVRQLVLGRGGTVVDEPAEPREPPSARVAT